MVIITDKNTTASRKPELSELMEYVGVKAGVKWPAIGLKLGITNAKLNAIDKDCRGKTDDCCREMFDHWLNTNPDANWREVIEALNTAYVGEDTLAVQLYEWLVDGTFPN